MIQNEGVKKSKWKQYEKGDTKYCGYHKNQADFPPLGSSRDINQSDKIHFKFLRKVTIVIYYFCFSRYVFFCQSFGFSSGLTLNMLKCQYTI
ncbi:MAG: hypothetical protein AAB503_02885 [Patescibacteria group bacterium]